jgi:hypothetical protein
MNTSGRVFHPCSIEDHLSREQIIRFATLLDECIEKGYGQVTITITNHHVNKVMVLFEEKLPYKKDC